MGMQYLYHEFLYHLRTFRNASYCRFVHLIILLLIPSLIFYPQSHIFAQIHEFSDDFDIQESQPPFTYDDVLDLIEKVESGNFTEKDFTSEELDKLNYFMCRLAYEGALEEDTLEFATLYQDSQDLFVDDIQPSLADTLYYCTLESTLDSDVPVMSALAYGRPDIMLCKSHKHKSVWQKTKAYVKKHKKAIIAGAVVVAMTIMALLNAQNKESTCPHRNNTQPPEPLAIVDTVIAKNSPLNEPEAQIELQAIRDRISEGNLLYTEDPNYPFEERCRAVQEAYPITAHQETFEYAKPVSFEENVYQCRGERALELEYYDQAISDCNKVISINPNDSEAYLNRATAHLSIGNIDNSLADFQKYNEIQNSPIKNAYEFSSSFVKGVAIGTRHSGKDLIIFAGDVVTRPISTAKEMYRGCKELAGLALTNEWAMIAEALAPEIRELAVNWHNLSQSRRGELAGYALGKYGADILIPATSMKILAKAKNANKIAKASKMFHNAEKTIALERLAQSSEICATSVERVATIAENTSKIKKTLTAAIIDPTAINQNKLLAAGQVYDRGGFSRAGRALMKHGYRDGVFPKPLGTPSAINEYGQSVLKHILEDKNKKVLLCSNGDIKIYSSSGQGAHFTKNDFFVGFIEAQYE